MVWSQYVYEATNGFDPDASDDDDGESFRTLAALGVTVRNTKELEAEYKKDWERAAEEQRLAKLGKQPQQKVPAHRAAAGTSTGMQQPAEASPATIAPLTREE